MSLTLHCALLLALFVSAFAEVKEKLHWKDLSVLDSSQNDVMDAFREAYRLRPNGISVNDYTAFSSMYPTPTKHFGRPCYKNLGKITYKPSVDGDVRKVTVATGVLYNFGKTTSTLSTMLQASWTESATVTMSTNKTFEFDAAIPIEGAFKMGLEFSVGNRPYDRVKTYTRNYSNQVAMDVPAMSFIRIEAVATMKTQTIDFEAPVSVDGDFGANFSWMARPYFSLGRMSKTLPGDIIVWRKRVVCFLPASKILPITSGMWKGQVKGVKAVDVKVKIHPAEPIAAAT